jgi:hypothetical protein
MVRNAPDVDPAHLLAIRRSSIDAVFSSLVELGPDVPIDQVSCVVETGLQRPELAFLDDLDGGRQGMVDQAIEEFGRFRPNQASSAGSAAALVRILLLQSLDLAWWGAVPDYVHDAAVASADDLVDLTSLRRAGRIEFGFGVASDGWVHRGRDFLIHRLLPDREPQGPGLPFVRARPAMVALLNELATSVAAKAPSGAPAMWVNSIVRSVDHQRKLRRLGFSALLPSAHCRGWAADIELNWFERFGAAEALREVLLGQLDAGVLNVIDEGRAWHVCLAPEHVPRFEALALASFPPATN